MVLTGSLRGPLPLPQSDCVELKLKLQAADDATTKASIGLCGIEIICPRSITCCWPTKPQSDCVELKYATFAGVATIGSRPQSDCVELKLHIRQQRGQGPLSLNRTVWN